MRKLKTKTNCATMTVSMNYFYIVSLPTELFIKENTRRWIILFLVNVEKILKWYNSSSVTSGNDKMPG